MVRYAVYVSDAMPHCLLPHTLRFFKHTLVCLGPLPRMPTFLPSSYSCAPRRTHCSARQGGTSRYLDHSCGGPDLYLRHLPTDPRSTATPPNACALVVRSAGFAVLVYTLGPYSPRFCEPGSCCCPVTKRVVRVPHAFGCSVTTIPTLVRY